MNPRVSRSSALASKATGFPIAKVAAKLAVGYTLDELDNDITGGHAGLLRADHRLRRHQDPALHLREVRRMRKPTLTTSMKSVGEAMAIGRSFAESLQKALRSMETGLTGLDEIELPGAREGEGRASTGMRARRLWPARCPTAAARRAGAAPRLRSRRSRRDLRSIPGSCEQIARHWSPPRRRCASQRAAGRLGDLASISSAWASPTPAWPS